MAISKDGIRYQMLDEETLDGAIQCASRVFCAREPLAHHLNITQEEFLIFAKAFYPSLIEQQLSFVAVDETTNQVIGIRVSEDCYDEEPAPEIEGLSPKFQPLFSLLGELSRHFTKIRKVVPGKYVHMFMVAVEDGYEGRGIAPNMNQMFFSHLKKTSYAHAVTEPTGEISQHILRDKFGFKVLHEIKYGDFVFEGTRPFADLQKHTSAILMEKDLSELVF